MAALRRSRRWMHLSDEDLLKVRIRDLAARIPGSEVQPRVRQLYHELDERGIPLRPVCYLADEWLSPDGQPVIGIPFYLAHPRLKSLEFRMMFEVEGGTASSCMRLLRHEAGHALDHGYRLHQRPDWQRVFGSPRAAYQPNFYKADPHSTHHVRNLPDNYAQAHALEDFAETFAVWLNPYSQWRTRYQGWPALRKLRYVDRLMREIATLPLPRKRGVPDFEAKSARATHKTYYERKFRLYRLRDLSFAARDLRGIFRVSRAAEPQGLASALIRRHKRLLVEAIVAWSGERPREVGRVIAEMCRMCDERSLVVRGDGPADLVRFSTYVSTLILNRLRTHRYVLRQS